MEKIDEQVDVHQYLNEPQTFNVLKDEDITLCDGLSCRAVENVLDNSVQFPCAECIGKFNMSQLRKAEPNLSTDNITQAIKTVILLDIK